MSGEVAAPPPVAQSGERGQATPARPASTADRPAPTQETSAANDQVAAQAADAQEAIAEATKIVTGSDETAHVAMKNLSQMNLKDSNADDLDKASRVNTTKVVDEQTGEVTEAVIEPMEANTAESTGKNEIPAEITIDKATAPKAADNDQPQEGAKNDGRAGERTNADDTIDAEAQTPDAENAQLKADLLAAQKANDQLQRNNNALSEQSEQLKQHNAELQTEVNRLQEQIAAVAANMDTLNQQVHAVINQGKKNGTITEKQEESLLEILAKLVAMLAVTTTIGEVT